MTRLSIDATSLDSYTVYIPSTGLPVLIAQSGTTPLRGSQTFTARRVTSDGHWVGTLRSSNGASSSARQVVCKYRSHRNFSSIEREAHFYQTKLFQLQGVAVPRFYGLFKGHYDEGGYRQDVACILLEYFEGDATSIWNIAKKSLKLREQVAGAMLKIHLAGLSLGELDAEHFLLSDAGEVRIVNFGRANVHKCHAKKELDVQAWEPKQQDYDCNELYLLMQEFELWTPGSFTFLNSEWPIFSYPTYEHLVEFYFRCPPHHPAMIEEVEEFAQEAREALDRFYAQYEERFPLIGDPRMIKPKAGNDSNTASSPSLGRRLQQFFSSAR